VFAGIAIYCLRIWRTCYWRYEQIIMLVLVALLTAIAIAFLLPRIGLALSGLWWFLFKLSVFIYLVIWLRATLPRLRYDQLMKLGWKWLIPLGLGGVALNAVLGLV
jgi:NADH-quinone oxidoreductase subunit H